MFSADLSWTDSSTEKVGERRERKAKERSLHSTTPSVTSSRSSITSSLADERQLWWTSSLRKAKNFKPNKKARPSTSRSIVTDASRPTSTVLRSIEPESIRELKDPSLQPGWTYSSTLSSNLPSGAPLDPPAPEFEVPELEGDLSSRGANSTGSRSSHERRWSLKPYPKLHIADEIDEIQPRTPRSFITRTTRRSSVAAQFDDIATITPTTSYENKKQNGSVNIDASMGLERLKLQDQPEEDVAPVPPIETHRSHANGFASSKLAPWVPPNDWHVLQPESMQDFERPLKQRKELPPTPVLNGITMAQNSLLELTRFQRFIRRMESAGPKVILDRLKEEWDDQNDEETNEELHLEKRLWVLTAFQLQNTGRLQSNPQPKCNTGKILEMYGDLAEVYQLSAMHPRHKVQYLTTEPQRPMPLPGNVSYTTVSQPGLIPCPWPDATFSRIRASTLPSLVPSSKLPQLLRECHRLLAPGGVLEIRIMDAAPLRTTAGPLLRAWIEDRLSINLEKTFRCSKPCMLFPGWIADAGFELPTEEGVNEVMQLPCAFDGSCVDAELRMLVGRALWKDTWGPYVDVDETSNEARSWWEDDEIVDECVKHGTVFECGAIFAYKR
ncbi:hypothetical protein DPSP01_000320 [Paraphaeosphaeria sporulosa]|uniref:Methyltransferase type 11 domain-containing protein n=1 Tax=Paraphaeosphaeria sporulosa TaxID=1460663 RepID=A0A177CZK8_9PLEO|nr:uncharacterized protein CC84DRAFT_1135693 [Paraphaeosphaeria sporulosa]OAG12746.1 hypothetical protein CC84DRAFT_1135693 [Paraphaeosphaeria sporulosa]